MCDRDPALKLADLYAGLAPELEPRVARLTMGANPPTGPEVPWTEARIVAMPPEQLDEMSGQAICVASVPRDRHPFVTLGDAVRAHAGLPVA